MLRERSPLVIEKNDSAYVQEASRNKSDEFHHIDLQSGESRLKHTSTVILQVMARLSSIE